MSLARNGTRAEDSVWFCCWQIHKVTENPAEVKRGESTICTCLLLMWARLMAPVQGRADDRTVKSSPSWSPSCLNPQVEAEEKALSEAWALELADWISSIMVLRIVYFLASKHGEEPGTTTFSRCLLPLCSLGGGAWLHPAAYMSIHVSPTSSASLESPD